MSEGNRGHLCAICQFIFKNFRSDPSKTDKLLGWAVIKDSGWSVTRFWTAVREDCYVCVRIWREMQPLKEHEVQDANMELYGLKYLSCGHSLVAGEILCLAFYLQQRSGTHKNYVVSFYLTEVDSRSSVVFDDTG